MKWAAVGRHKFHWNVSSNNNSIWSKFCFVSTKFMLVIQPKLFNCSSLGTLSSFSSNLPSGEQKEEGKKKVQHKWTIKWIVANVLLVIFQFSYVKQAWDFPTNAKLKWTMPLETKTVCTKISWISAYNVKHCVGYCAVPCFLLVFPWWHTEASCQEQNIRTSPTLHMQLLSPNYCIMCPHHQWNTTLMWLGKPQEHLALITLPPPHTLFASKTH